MTKDEYKKAVADAKRRAWPEPPKVPRCCATCDYLTSEGRCAAFDSYPPLEFIEQENDCKEYIELLPF